MPDEPQPSALPKTKQVRAEQSTERLLEAACALIAEQGYERTTLADIGRRAGYSHGLVTQRFGSKQGMLSALIEWAEVRWASELPAHEPDEPEPVADIVTAVRKNLRHAPHLLRGQYGLMFEAYKPIPVTHELMVEAHRHIRERIAGDVKQGVAAGTIAPVDPAVFSSYVISVLRGLEYDWLMDEKFNLDSHLAWFEEHLREDLAPPRRKPAKRAKRPAAKTAKGQRSGRGK